MKEGDPGLDARLEEPVHEAVVEIQAFHIRWASARRLNARPSDRKAIGANADDAHECDILGAPAVVVAGHGARVAGVDLSGLSAIVIPDRGTSPISCRRALYLISGGRGAPDKILWEG